MTVPVTMLPPFLLRVARYLRTTAVGVLLLSGLYTQGALAASFTIANPDRTVAPASTSLFSASVMNDTGVDLNTSDLFLNFSGFDPTVISLTQVLGDVTVLIPNGTTSPTNDLFTATVGLGLVPGKTYFVDVILQDGNENLTGVQTISLRSVPEPSSVLLLFTGVIAIVAGVQWRTRHHRVQS